MKQSAAGSGLGPTVGNGIAYFVLWYLANNKGIEFADPELALVFAGGLVATLLLEVRRLFSGIASLLNRFLPPKKED